MNFTDWYKKFYGDNKNSDCYFASEAAWIACKNHLKREVLKIINDNLDTKPFHLIKKIEKL